MKKDLINQWALLWIALFPLLMLSGCSKRGLEAVSDEGVVNLSFSWGKLLSGESVPSGMKLYFYASDGSVVVRDCQGTTFSGTLPTGTYSVIAYSKDATSVSFRGMDSYSSAQAYIPEYTRAASYLSQPSSFYGVSLGTLSVSFEEDAQATLAPTPYVHKANLDMTITGARSGISSAVATIDGMASSLNLSTGTLGSEAGSIAFTPLLDKEQSSYPISFFGPVSSLPNKLSVRFDFVSGGSQTIEIDITKALSSGISLSIPIEINVNFEVTGSVAAGFSAKVTDWSVVNKETPIH